MQAAAKHRADKPAKEHPRQTAKDGRDEKCPGAEINKEKSQPEENAAALNPLPLRGELYHKLVRSRLNHSLLPSYKNLLTDNIIYRRVGAIFRMQLNGSPSTY